MWVCTYSYTFSKLVWHNDSSAACQFNADGCVQHTKVKLFHKDDTGYPCSMVIMNLLFFICIDSVLLWRLTTREVAFCTGLSMMSYWLCQKQSIKVTKSKSVGLKKYTGQDELCIQYNNLPYMYTFHVAVTRKQINPVFSAYLVADK